MIEKPLVFKPRCSLDEQNQDQEIRWYDLIVGVTKPLIPACFILTFVFSSKSNNNNSSAFLRGDCARH